MSVTSTASSVQPHPQPPGRGRARRPRPSGHAWTGCTPSTWRPVSGPVLLLLHGHEQSATSWRWVIPALARTHRVLALSLPGHGDTAPAVGGYAPGARPGPLRGRLPRHPRHRPPLDLVGTLRRRGGRAAPGAGRPGPHPDR